jgi:hypothetical protein
LSPSHARADVCVSGTGSDRAVRACTTFIDAHRAILVEGALADLGATRTTGGAIVVAVFVVADVALGGDTRLDAHRRIAEGVSVHVPVERGEDAFVHHIVAIVVALVAHFGPARKAAVAVVVAVVVVVDVSLGRGAGRHRDVGIAKCVSVHVSEEVPFDAGVGSRIDTRVTPSVRQVGRIHTAIRRWTSVEGNDASVGPFTDAELRSRDEPVWTHAALRFSV